jgi:hypothetical protein
MGTASTTKVIKQVAGTLTEIAALTTSAGAGDAQAIPALNASGILDDTIINSSATSSADKVVKMNGSGIIAPNILNATTTSAGAGDVGKILQLDSSGRIDSTVLPIGIGADTATIVTSEALAAGDFINIWTSTGTKVRKADATVSGKHAMGFVLSAFGSGASATVYFEGTNTAVTGQTGGDVFLSTTAGQAVATAPSASGNVVQPIGIAITAASINFQYNRPIVLV